MDRNWMCPILCALAVAAAPSQAKLIHHWQFEEDPSVTTTVVDSVGGLNGTIEGPASVAGKAGKALSFDGSNDRVRVQGFAAPAEGTIVLWINPSLAKSKERFLGTGGDFEVWLRSNGELKNELFDNGSTTVGTGAGAVKANEWCHVAVTYDGAAKTVEIYLNGELKKAGTANLPAVPTGTVLQFGSRPGIGAGEYYKGLLDDIQMYDEILTAEQLKPLFENPGTTVVTATIKASGPSPAEGAKDVLSDAVLTWTPGLYTKGLPAKHRVFFSADFDDVNGVATGVVQDGERYPATESLDLDLGKTYYWRVDEANSVTGWDRGDIWTFTVADYLVVDSFEDYNDIEPDRIFDVWLDGWSDSANGSVVGNPTSPFAEQTIVHSGKQAMPFRYENGGPAKYSEAVVYLDDLSCPRDWTTGEVKVLSLWVRGRLPGTPPSGNQAELMYVALSSKNGRTGTIYHTDPKVTVTNAWTEWTIDLKQFSDQGVNLTDISKLTIGFGDKNSPQLGGTGMMYFDDIRLYLPRPAPK